MGRALSRLLLLSLGTILVPACGGGGGGGTGGIPVPFSASLGFNGNVVAITAAGDGSGDFFAAGPFTLYGSTAANRVIRLNSDGTVDPSFATGNGFDSSVVAVAVDAGGDVYAGGAFLDYDGTTQIRIVRLNADGSVDAGFSTGTGFDGTVYSIVLATDGSGDVYVGGDFDDYNGTAASGVIRLNSDGTVDVGFAVGAASPSVVRVLALAVDGSGDLYVGGHFSSYGVSTVDRIVRLNSDGTVDAGFAVGNGGFDNTVRTIVPAADGSGDIYIGGSFNFNENLVTYRRLVRMNSDGSVDTAFDVGTGFTGSVYSIALVPGGGGDLVVGGDITAYKASPVPGIIRLNSDGSADPSMAVGTGFQSPGYVLALAPAPDGSGDLYVGGDFVAYKDFGANRLVRLNWDGSVDAGFAVGAGFDDWVHVIAGASDGSGDLFVGGVFGLYDGTSTRGFVRLNMDGSVDASLTVGTGFNGAVHGIAPVGDGSGDVYVGGAFTNYNGTGLNRFARLDPDGMLDAGFALGGFSSDVHAVASVPDGTGDVYVGGIFGSYSGTTANGIIRLNGDGTADAGFATGAGCNDRVWTIAPAIDGSGDVYLGGEFTTYDGAASSRIVRVNSDGSRDTGFAVGTGFSGTVRVILPATDGSGNIHVVGLFGTYDGSPSAGIILLDSGGAVVGGFAVGTGFTGQVLALAPALDGSGDVYVGGTFTQYQGSAAGRLIRLKPDGSPEPTFITGGGFNSNVTTVFPGPAGGVYAGGYFTSYRSTLADGIVHLMGDGGVN